MATALPSGSFAHSRVNHLMLSGVQFLMEAFYSNGIDTAKWMTIRHEKLVKRSRVKKDSSKKTTQTTLKKVG